MKGKYWFGLNFFRKVPSYVWVLLVIIGIGTFFRVYQHHDWLQFKGDAFRDATLISNIFDTGVESLPLLGPRAGGTMLRLGPIFYYFQSAAAALFQSLDASVLAYPDLFFSILSIPLFFFFVRRYFSIGWSLSMAALLAVSFLAIEYGRFAWNPNSTLFFTLLFSYALLRLYGDEAEQPRPLLWAGLAGVALAIASQLHFSAFLGLPLALILFALFQWREAKRVLSPGVLAVFFLSVAIIYVPVFISEFFKHGENTRLFFSAISSKAASHGIFQNIYQTAHMFAKYFVRITLGFVEPGKTLLLLSGIFCGLGFLANVFLWRDETNRARRHFLQWILVLIVVYFLLYIPLAFKIDRPRFYLPFMMVPYLYLGFIVVFLQKKTAFSRAVLFMGIFGLFVMLVSNVRATTSWFTELRNSEQTATSTGERNSKGRSFFLTWGHFERAARAIDASCDPRYDIYFSMAKGIAEYDHSVEYALLERQRQWGAVEKTDASQERLVCYYYLSFPQDVLPESIVRMRQDAPVDVGNIRVIHLYPEGAEKDALKKNKITVEREREVQVFSPEKITRYSRVFWGDVWYRMTQP